ncbi:MAG: prepilin-type N-terminal cleavage/methylation domain-containing protein [Burkholderiaceae bacterium]|nr:prepilin-type N-terminal cleavage/methylation domain-containing protein [Burkholderiaceae bacterium]
MKTLKKQGGFTLVEIAIVLVIVGLLLAGVLKGQELIENSKIKNIAKDMDALSASVLSYRDRYKALPADEVGNTTTMYGWAANVGGGDNNGLIGAATVDPFTVIAGENVNAFRALRYAGFIGGNPADAGANARPAHAAGGNVALGNTLWGLSGNVVCLNNLTGKFAGALDRLIDDGVNTTGIVRASTVAPTVTGAPAAAQYIEATTGFFLCKQL